MTDTYFIKKNISETSLWSGKSPLLRHLDIELTERCNNNCLHCCINLPEKDEKTKERELKTEGWKEILKEAAELGALSVRFTGGEPLLREDFTELYLFARHLGLKVLLYTNARLITPELANLLTRIPPLKKIEVSVYGMRVESYQAVTRRSGSFAEFRQGVDLLLEKRVPFEVKGALLPPNRDEIAEFDAWAAQIPGMDHPPSYAMLYELRGRRDSEIKNRQIMELRVSPEEDLSVLTRHKERFLMEMKQFCQRFLGPPGDFLFPCGAGHGGCIDAYGRYQACLGLRDPSLTFDLKKGTLKEALTRFVPRLREMRAQNPEYLERCAQCSIKGLCEQCPARSWSENGTLDTPVEYLCQWAHALAEYLGITKGQRAQSMGQRAKLKAGIS